MQKIKVLSYNIHKGFTLTNRSFVLKEMREAIRKIAPDIVFLQEVLGEHELHEIEEWPSNCQFEFMAHEIWEHYAYGKNAVYAKGHHGNAILSKFPVIFSENINVSTNRWEKRGVLHVILELPEKQKLHTLCTHFDLGEKGRQKQLNKLCQRISDKVPHTEPLVLAGDFNDWKNNISSELQKRLAMEEFYLTKHGHLAKTFPSFSPFLRLDRIYFRGLNVQSAQRLTGSPWRNLSDHLALFGVFGI